MFYGEVQIISIAPVRLTQGCFLFDRLPGTIWFDDSIKNDCFVLERTPKFRALEAHFVDGVPWEDTGVIDEVLYLRQMKARDRGCSWPTRIDVLNRYRELDAVFQDIMQRGYDDQKGSPINVAVDSDNSVYFCGNGWHRLWICQHFNISAVPCRVVARHVESRIDSCEVMKVKLSLTSRSSRKWLMGQLKRAIRAPRT